MSWLEVCYERVEHRQYLLQAYRTTIQANLSWNEIFASSDALVPVQKAINMSVEEWLLKGTSSQCNDSEGAPANHQQGEPSVWTAVPPTGLGGVVCMHGS